MIIKLFFVLKFLFLFIKCENQYKNLRYLETTAKNITNITIPIVILPLCKSDNDCSNRGTCNLSTGKCLCQNGYDTFISPHIVNELARRAANKVSDKVNTTATNNYTIFYRPLNFTTDDIQYCNYEKKKQLTALLLSVLVGFGSEHFYLERYKSAAAKIVFSVFCCALNIVYFIMYKCVKDGKKYVDFIGTFEAFYLSCGFIYMILWTIYDCVNIGFDNYYDGNGMRMQPWNMTG